MSVTSNLRSDARTTPPPQPTIDDLTRKRLIDQVVAVADCTSSPTATQEDAFDAEAKLMTLIEEHLGDDFVDQYNHRWSVPKQAANRYHAGKWLTTFINSGLKDGFIIETAGATA